MKLSALLVLTTAARFGAGYDIDLAEPAVGRREALNIGPEPSSSSSSLVATSTLLLPSPSTGCTTTLSITRSSPCKWDGTSTVYTSTAVLYEQINCNGCDRVSVYEEWFFCPNQPITATVSAESPATSWSTVCQPSSPPSADPSEPNPSTAVITATVRPHPTFPTGRPFPTPTNEPGPRRARRHARHL
ncbi:hypothetical protein VTH06DRAFT_3140 [Thermothelomyces fergusii]